MSRLTLYFEDSEFEVSERYAIFGSMDFLASAGELFRASKLFQNLT